MIGWTCSYDGIEEGVLIHALWCAMRAQGLGIFDDRVTVDDVRAEIVGMIDEDGLIKIDYLRGRPLKIDIDTRAKLVHRVPVYDRDAGAGTLARVVAMLGGPSACLYTPPPRVIEPELPPPREPPPRQTRARFYTVDGFMEFHDLDPDRYPIFKVCDLPSPDEVYDLSDRAPHSFRHSVRTYERRTVRYPEGYLGPIEPEAFRIEYGNVFEKKRGWQVFRYYEVPQ